MTGEDLRYAAVKSRDARFDGWFFVGVTSTRIYCRPSCASVTPRRDRVEFFPTAAAAQRAGFRTCKRCRPDAAPGSPEWNRRGDVVGRAMRAIADGIIDREGVGGLAALLGYSTRQLNRLLVSEVGAGPLELARAQRAHTARILLETTSLRIAEVAFAAGFGSVRQFNDTVRAVYGEAPGALRARRGGASRREGGTASLSLRLAYRRPHDVSRLLSFLAARAVPEVEEGSAGSYARTLSLPHGCGRASLAAPGPNEPFCRVILELEDLRDLTTAVRRLRRLLDLDADPAAVGDVLGRDPFLTKAVREFPGLRVPGHVDGAELAVRAVLGQQVSVTGARALAGRLAQRYGSDLRVGAGSGPQRLFPRPEVLAALSPFELPMPVSRARALIALCGALSSGEIVLDEGVDRDEVSARLLSIRGIGPWTVAYVRMRALADPDAFLPTDLGVRRALERRGRAGDPASASAAAEAWRPYRSYGLQYLWASPRPGVSPLAPGDDSRTRVPKEEDVA